MFRISCIYRGINLSNKNFYLNSTRFLADITSDSLAYSEKDTEKLLDTMNKPVNELERYKIAKTKIKQIELWRNNHGQFQNLEQIFEIQGFSDKIVNKFFHSILNIENTIKSPTPGAPISKRIGNFCTPAIPEINRLTYKTCVAIRVGISSVTWVKLRINSIQDNLILLEDWYNYEITNNKLHVPDLAKKCIKIEELLPHADCYVFETPQLIQTTSLSGGTEQIKTNIQKAQLLGILNFILIKRNTYNDSENEDQKHQKSNLFYLKRFVASRLFNTFLSNEKVSSEHVILKLMRTHYNINKSETEEIEFDEKKPLENQINVIFPMEFRQMYNLSRGHQREFLGQTLLLGLAFIKLCLMKCPYSLAIMNINKKRMQQ